jgi:hypothetical protein
MSAKNPINTSTFGFTDTRTQDTLQMDDTDAKVTVRKIIGHFEAAPMDAERQENRVRDVRDAKNPSDTSTFCGHSPMSANVRDVRDEGASSDNLSPRKRRNRAKELAEQFGVSVRTIYRSAHFANAMERLRAVSPEAAQIVLDDKVHGALTYLPKFLNEPLAFPFVAQQILRGVRSMQEIWEAWQRIYLRTFRLFTKSVLHMPEGLEFPLLCQHDNANNDEPSKDDLVADQLSPQSPDANGLEVKVVCLTCGSWRRVPPDAFLLTAPRCPVCGEVMRPEPEGDPPEGGAPTPADPPPADPAFVDTDQWLAEWASDPPPANAPTDQLTKPVPRLSSLPDGIACQCGGRLRAVGREYLCDHCQRPLPAVCGRCYRVLFVGAEGRAMCKTCQVAYAFKDGHWREVSRDGSTEVSL